MALMPGTKGKMATTKIMKGLANMVKAMGKGK